LIIMLFVLSNFNDITFNNIYGNKTVSTT
jgi:hypothetical protein